MLIEKAAFIEMFHSQGFEISEEMYDQFSIYSELLVEWNKKINLTAITSPEDIAAKHFLDSLLPLKFLNIKEKASLIDVGTGAGFPSVPIKIFRKDVNITLLDSLNKRVNFLKDVSEKVGFDASFVHSRAEDGGNKQELREKFDYSCARAVANLSELCEYCLPFVKVGGTFFALKGSNGLEEVQKAKSAIKKLGGEIVECYEYNLPNFDKRTLVEICKISQTATKYPRNSGIIKRKPL